MSYTVGLDFGTHQTKVCIEDASNPAQKIYEFFEFDDLKGGKTVLFPSLVQINIDDTLSYGFIKETECKTMSFFTAPKPILELSFEPKLDLPKQPEKLAYPPKPKKPVLKGFNIKEQISMQEKFKKDEVEWVKQCQQIDGEHEQKTDNWKLDCTAVRKNYDYEITKYISEKEKKQIEFEKAMTKWEKDNLPKKQIFRYFKLATFYYQDWKYEIIPETISVWYLTFVLFKIQEKLGTDFYTQMGVPYSIISHEADNQKKIALKLLITANYLISEYQNLDNFLKAKYIDLIEKTELQDCNKKVISELGINVLPESFAGLSSITQQGKLNIGMHLLADIGGGTTDIAFFTITENKLPNIHAVLSFPQGLNYIFEEYQKENKMHSIAQIQQFFSESHKPFRSSITLFQNQLRNKTVNMIQQIKNQFIKKQHNHNWEYSRLEDALANRPIVYCGGGSMYDIMRIPLRNFTDIKLINKNLLSIPYVKNRNIDDSLFTILATSYGLSIQLENKIKMTPIEKVFDLQKQEIKRRYDGSYEHGLSDT